MLFQVAVHLVLHRFVHWARNLMLVSWLLKKPLLSISKVPPIRHGMTSDGIVLAAFPPSDL